jgi:hypothetical protein
MAWHPHSAKRERSSIDGQTGRFKQAGTSTVRESTVRKRPGRACLVSVLARHAPCPCPCPCWKPHTTARHGHGPLHQPAPGTGAVGSLRPSDLLRPFIPVTRPTIYMEGGETLASLCSFPFLSPPLALSSLLSPSLSREGRNSSPRLPGGRWSSQPHGV